MASSADFIEEIDYNELDILDPVGKGSFGVVYMAIWRGIHVAVKMIESESERIAFTTELRQLSRVSHPNIVCLYGACRSPVSLVMELAECGSLYNLLHGPGPQPHYNSGHSMSWCLQCATGVAYLHGMKPKPIIHRDLKPPNLLLTNNGVVLKICDFGTACDQHTHMTNNKGSAAWMAPEVFEGCQYSEKCDVFSWGIILWEVLTRKKPFDDLGGPAFRIMWAVHTGARPNLIQGCPKPVEELMTSCWSAKPNERPSMDEIIDAMNDLMTFFPGGQTPLVFPSHDIDSSSEGSSGYNTNVSDSFRVNPGVGTISDTIRTNVSRNSPTIYDRPWGQKNSPSLARHQDFHEARNRSRSHTPDPQRLPTDPTRLPFKKGHRRASSYGNKLDVPANPLWPRALAEVAKEQRTRRSSTEIFIAEIDQQPIIRTPPGGSRSNSPALGKPINRAIPGLNPPFGSPGPTPKYKKNRSSECLPRAYITLELHLQPLPPSTSSQESLEIYRKHCLLAEKYLKVLTEISFLKQRAEQLKNVLEQDEKAKLEGDRLMLEYQQLVAENTSLQKWYDKMKKDLARVREKGQSKMWS